MEKYVHKITDEKFDNAFWNIPEQKRGILNVVGGNAQSFRTEVKTAESLTKNFPLQAVNLILPNALRDKLPPLDNLRFLSSTESGSLARADELAKAMNSADFNLILGDFSKNSITGKAVASACEIAEKPLLITRDTVDLLAENGATELLLRDDVIFLASMPQLQKLLRSVYYPRMILLSQPIMQIAETLHKFTLSYPTRVITLVNGIIAVADAGEIMLIPLERTAYTPMTFWGGEVAGRIAGLAIYNPVDFMGVCGGGIMGG